MDFTSTTIQYTGRQRKFREFYLTYKDKVYTYAFSHLKDKDMAVDVVQEAFTRIWKKVTAGEEPNNLQSYLYTGYSISVSTRGTDRSNYYPKVSGKFSAGTDHSLLRLPPYRLSEMEDQSFIQYECQ